MSAPTEETRIGRGLTLAGISALSGACFLHAFQAAGPEGGRAAVVSAMLICSAGWNVIAALISRGGRESTASRRLWWTTVGFLALCTVAGNYAVSAALSYLVAGVASVILQTQVFVVGLMSWIFLRERMPKSLLLGAVLAVSGVAVISLKDLDAATASASARGIPLAFLGTLSFGGILVWTRAVIHQMSPVPVNATRLVVASAVLLALPGNWGELMELTPRGWLFAALAAAFGPFGSRLLLMEAVRYISAARTKLMSLLGPIFAFAISGVLYSQAPLPREIGGGALILLGVLLPTAIAVLERRSK